MAFFLRLESQYQVKAHQRWSFASKESNQAEAKESTYNPAQAPLRDPELEPAGLPEERQALILRKQWFPQSERERVEGNTESRVERE